MVDPLTVSYTFNNSDNQGSQFREVEFPNSSVLVPHQQTNSGLTYLITIERTMNLKVYEIEYNAKKPIKVFKSYTLKSKYIDTDTPMCANM